MPGREWCYVRGGKRHGPVPTAELLLRAAAGDVGRDDLVWPADAPGKAAPGGTVKGLFPQSGDTDPERPAVASTPAPRPPDARPLVACGRCGAGVSDTAETCPHCGERQPRAVHLADGWDAGEYERCGTFNLVGRGSGGFRDEPGARCRGCRTSLAEAYPAARLYSEKEKVGANAWAACRACAPPAAVAAYVAHQGLLSGQPGAWLMGCWSAALGFGVVWAAVMVLVELAGFRRWFWDRSPLAGRIFRGVIRGEQLPLWGGTGSPPRGAIVWSKGTWKWLNWPPPVSAEWYRNPAWYREMAGIIVVVAVFVAVGGVPLMHAKFYGPYAQGKKQGASFVREKVASGALAPGADVPDSVIPSPSQASAEWKAGFQAGFRAELERLARGRRE